MKKIITMMLAVGSMLFMSMSAISQTNENATNIVEVENYSLKLRLNVPRIYNNNESLGSRKYQSQLVVGTMQLYYDKSGQLVDVQFKDLVNRKHKLSNGKNVTYTTALDSTVYPRFNVIGSNKTKEFNTASVCFSIAAEPSYNIGEMNEDNGLYLVLAGKGKISKKQLKSLSGTAAGTIGCGCMAYGHVSPTRTLGFWGATDIVDDVAAIHGTWSAKLVK